MTGLEYLGVDLMIDETLGPLMIQVNAGPGLAIQMANGVGLLRRLEPVVELHASQPGEGHTDKIAFLKACFAAKLTGGVAQTCASSHFSLKWRREKIAAWVTRSRPKTIHTPVSVTCVKCCSIHSSNTR